MRKIILLALLGLSLLCPDGLAHGASGGACSPSQYQMEQVLKIMQKYGMVDQSRLSQEYWKELACAVSEEGSADKILSLEYHGDNYYMYKGSYSMDPDEFTRQMTYLCDNGYHFVTGPEIVGYVEGWLNLPKKSIILTTDSGRQSISSLPRMTSLFEKLNSQSGCQPHMISFIWSGTMAKEETVSCKDDVCWEAFRKANASGYFTFGTHTESHENFTEKDSDFLANDLAISIEDIENNLGITPYLLSWPFEACAVGAEESGILAAFGGASKPIRKNYVERNDQLGYCLPRMFPPNPLSESSRPKGYTFVQMLDEALGK